MAYSHFTQIDRERLSVYISEGHSISAAAKKIGKDKSAVSRELKRTRCDSGIGYLPEFAEHHAKQRRSNANKAREKIDEDSDLAKHIFEKLRARWSPEDISVKLKAQKKLPHVCPKTIYSFVENRHPEFKRYLSVLSRKKPRPKGSGKKEMIPDRTWIDERPSEVDERKTVGHWEGDTIVSGCRKQAIATFNERFSGYLLAKKMPDRTATELNSAAVKLMSSLPLEKRKTCTEDNGPEFAGHKELAKELKIKIYFAHPYHSWERGINERSNRELRRFFPKGTMFSEVPKWELDWAVKLINNKPRKRLNYHTPFEVFHGDEIVAL